MSEGIADFRLPIADLSFQNMRRTDTPQRQLGSSRYSHEQGANWQ